MTGSPYDTKTKKVFLHRFFQRDDKSLTVKMKSKTAEGRKGIVFPGNHGDDVGWNNKIFEQHTQSGKKNVMQLLSPLSHC